MQEHFELMSNEPLVLPYWFCVCLSRCYMPWLQSRTRHSSCCT